MPLKPGNSPEVKSQNIREFHTGKTYAHTKAKFGKKRADAQAIAVALDTARKYAKGGDAIAGMALKGSSINLGREGLIKSSIPGRIDKIPMKVKAGSYILPADIPSALGQGNTMAGGEILKKMFSAGPYGMAPMKGGRGGTSGRRLKGLFDAGGEVQPLEITPRNPQGSKKEASIPRGQQSWVRPLFPGDPGYRPWATPKADGGDVEEGGDDHVDIIAAGGEYRIPPEVVQDIGHGSMKAGHDVLDKFVLKVRKHHIETLKKLPKPKQ